MPQGRGSRKFPSSWSALNGSAEVLVDNAGNAGVRATFAKFATLVAPLPAPFVDAHPDQHAGTQHQLKQSTILSVGRECNHDADGLDPAGSQKRCRAILRSTDKRA
jgi:hypothetical protein